MEIVYGNIHITLTPKEQAMLRQIVHAAAMISPQLSGEERDFASKLGAALR